MTLSHTVKKSPELLFDYLTDMQKFVSVHPVITKIEPLGANKYKVFETLRFLFIPYSFTYFVTIESIENKTVIIKATVMKSTKIEMIFQLSAKDNVCVIDEEVTFKSKLPIKSMMSRIFRKQHIQLFKNIEELK